MICNYSDFYFLHVQRTYRAHNNGFVMRSVMIIISRQQNAIVLGKNFRIFGTFEEPLFLAKDVAEWIEHSNITMILGGIDEDEKVRISPKQSLGLLTANNSYNFLTEEGLYEVLMQSRKPVAKEFKKQVIVHHSPQGFVMRSATMPTSNF